MLELLSGSVFLKWWGKDALSEAESPAHFAEPLHAVGFAQEAAGEPFAQSGDDPYR